MQESEEEANISDLTMFSKIDEIGPDSSHGKRAVSFKLLMINY